MSEFSTLLAEWERIQQDQTLRQPENLLQRAQASNFVDYLRQIARARRHQPEVIALYKQALAYQQEWQSLNERLFAQFHYQIRDHTWRGPRLRTEFDRFTDYSAPYFGQAHFAADGLDLLVRGIWESQPLPAESQVPQAEMVHFERSPARILLELIDRLSPRPTDHFYDIGAGLGGVLFLIHSLTGIQVTGIEYQASYCAYATARAEELGLTGVEIVQEDAQAHDYAEGTIFFLFTPFRGRLLQTVLERIQCTTADHPITIGAYGPCARVVAQQPWLQALDDHAGHEYKLALFRSK
jgi:hypothetical protein